MISTKRLSLRPWQIDDAEALFKYASDERVSELALWPTHTSIEMSRNVIRDYFIPNPHTFAMILKESEEAIGCIGLVPEGNEHFTPESNEREIGYWIGYPFWNLGLTTEALTAFKGYCQTRLRLLSLLITTDTRNIASQKVAIKCGFSALEDYIFEGVPCKAFRLKL